MNGYGLGFAFVIVSYLFILFLFFCHLCCSFFTSITNLADTHSWKYYLNDSTYRVRYNDYRVNVDVSITGTSASTTFTAYGVAVIPNELRPKYPVSAIGHNGDVLVQIKDNDNKLYRKSTTSSSQSNINIYAHLEWDRR